MTDLSQQIRERLDGFAPPADDGPPPQFVEILDPGNLTQEQIEDWQRRWDEVMVTAADKSMHVLATAPRFYPGFEQMRDAIIGAVHAVHIADDEDVTDWQRGYRSAADNALRAIAEKLGIEADHG